MKLDIRGFIYSALKRLGGWYIPVSIIIVQLTAFVSGGVGIFFGQLNSQFDARQLSALTRFVMIDLVFVTLALAGWGYAFHRDLFNQLNDWARSGKRTGNSVQDVKAWRQVNSLPTNFAIVTLGLVSIGLVAPLLPYMYFVLSVSWDQLLYILMGGIGATLSGTVLASLLLDMLTQPVREISIPASFENQLAGFGAFRLFAKLLAVSVSVVLLSLLLVAPIGYHHTVLAANAGGNAQAALSSFQIQSWFASFYVILVGVFLTTLIIRSLTQPTRHLIDTFQQIEKGDMSQRVTISTADEVGELGAYFNHMVDRLATLQGSLESEVKERTAQLRATVQVANAISAILDTNQLIEQVVNLIANQFDYYYVALFLVDSTGKWAELSAATGEAGRVLKANRHRLELTSRSMVGRCISTREPTVTMDTTDSPARFENPLLPYTRSEIALPLIIGDRVLGALDAQSTRESEFGPDEIETLQTMANQVAVALENARLFQNTQQTLQDIRTLQRQYLLTSWKGFTEEKGTFDYAIGEIDPGEDLSEIDIPLMLRDQAIGEISVASQKEWTAEERGMIESIAAQAALALENARLVEESRSSARREHLVAEITGRIWASTTVDSILQTAAREIGRAFETDEVSIELKAGEHE